MVLSFFLLYMKFHKLESFYIVNKVKEHKKIKSKLLKLINKIPKSPLETISHTDWKLPKEYKREYLDFFYQSIKPYMNLISDEFKTKEWTIHNGWFQQYVINNEHDWHVHNNANYSNVYYLELPDKKMTTKFKGLNNETIDINAEEGDLVTFPAHMLHKSEPVKGRKRKTIISFNSDFYFE